MSRALEKPWDFPVEDHALVLFPVTGRCTEMTSKFRISVIQEDILFDPFLEDTLHQVLVHFSLYLEFLRSNLQ